MELLELRHVSNTSCYNVNCADADARNQFDGDIAFKGSSVRGLDPSAVIPIVLECSGVTVFLIHFLAFFKL